MLGVEVSTEETFRFLFPLDTGLNRSQGRLEAAGSHDSSGRAAASAAPPRTPAPPTGEGADSSARSLVSKIGETQETDPLLITVDD